MPTILHTAEDVASNVNAHLHHASDRVGDQLHINTDRFFPHKHRQEIYHKFRSYANQNPKTTAFLTTQTALTGIPLILFIAFAAATVFVSLTTCLALALLAAFTISFFAIGFALLFVVPTLFFASFAATFIFIWGFVGYIILRRFNEGEAPAKRGTRVGDALHGLTGGRSAFWGGGESHVEGHQASGEGPEHRRSLGVGANKKGTCHCVVSHQIDGGPVKGTHDPLQWERKWTDGVLDQPVVLETGNTYEVLKAEVPVS
ncbi:hypothetical protein EJ02DRAFT_449988 [Clathrospora elynae]|uniref:Uncharacterized protein n=1 Tax=Clathrospora elynae TaxID=706981 RepID=A0A6A5TDN0_9PLEO|nr:hypothetical protein EJ02DRAFT_449988 [Clathrospora elynae]